MFLSLSDTLKRLQKKLKQASRRLRNLSLPFSSSKADLDDPLYQLYYLADLGKLAQSVYHDMANPVNVISLNLESLQSKIVQGALVDATSQQALHRAFRASRHLEEFTRTIRQQLLRQPPETNIFNLVEEIENVLVLWSFRAQKHQVQLYFDTHKPVLIKGNTLRFNQLMSNIISNALDAFSNMPISPAEKHIRITIKEDPRALDILVADNASGMSEETLEQCFRPHFTTKANLGNGLGLWIAQTIVNQEFGGDILVTSEVGKGSTFRITIPMKTH